MNKSVTGKGLMLITCMIWGANSIFAKMALLTSTPYMYNFLRYLLGTILIFIIFKKHLKKINKELIKDSIVLAIFTFSSSILFSYALKTLPASEVGAYLALQVPLIPFIAFFVLKDKISTKNIMTAIMAFIGLIVLNYNGKGFNMSVGTLLVMLSAVAAALYIVFTEKDVQKEDAIALVLVQSALITVFSLIMLVVNNEINTINTISTYSIYGIILSGILSNTVAYVTQCLAQEKISASETGLLASTTPMFSIIFAMIILGETLTINQSIGSTIIISSVIIANQHFEFHRKHIKHH